jgi:phage terminase small subunit
MGKRVTWEFPAFLAFLVLLGRRDHKVRQVNQDVKVEKAILACPGWLEIEEKWAHRETVATEEVQDQLDQ